MYGEDGGALAWVRLRGPGMQIEGDRECERVEGSEVSVIVVVLRRTQGAEEGGPSGV